MKIGLSISMCVKDILNGEVNIEDVYCIIAGTMIQDQKNWFVLVDQYGDSYWKKFSKEDIWATLEQLIPIIYQPRLAGKQGPNISRGHWIDLNKDVYLSR
ncbi:MAG: hypothetical protein WC516_10005 [Patescibacteria group bacterium]|jgi:hypothetical protein|nr:hypothetical protein [Sideroxydans sp.]